MSASSLHGLLRSGPIATKPAPTATKTLPRAAERTRPLPVWWHLLSLDAPTVAVVWCFFFGAIFRLHFSWVALPTLALGTWWVYVADRLLDGWRSADTTELRDRHWFYLRHRKLFLGALMMAAVLLGYLILLRVPRPVRTDDIFLCLVGCCYFLFVHASFSPKFAAPRFSKELGVGFLFAVATATPAWARLRPMYGVRPTDVAIFAAAVFSFGMVCWLNCVAIQTWEDREASSEPMYAILCRNPKQEEVKQAGLTKLLGAHLMKFALAIGGMSLGLTVAFWRSGFCPLFASVTISAALFAGLIHSENRFNALSLRIAADLVLLTPLIFLTRVG